MTNDAAAAKAHFVDRTGDIVSAYVSNNYVAPKDLPALIATVHAAISILADGGTSVAVESDAPEKATAAQIRKSIQHDGIVSFIDGQSYKTLKRHLTKHGLDPKAYRDRFGLPGDYPMVSASYSETRSGLAKALGLGQQRRAAAQQEEVKPAPKRRKKAA